MKTVIVLNGKPRAGKTDEHAAVFDPAGEPVARLADIAHIGENHRRVGSGADAGQLDDPQSVKWSRHGYPPSIRRTLSTADIAYLYNQVDRI